ncbi:hypothetical protein OVN20_02015 [Microcella daejeonensis]|uniref:hypothetical protein n=1 Tax=Microcella daejeonensis TaxID=2994971 RepID=UPI00226D8B54|nr:hypothetical protein [Microcella daejeonensis]WAB84373.1 hypothetical protein OVN20_02015 [Microcella daejeonensis]
MSTLCRSRKPALRDPRGSRWWRHHAIPLDVWAHRTGRLEGGWRREATDDPRDRFWVDRLVRWMLRHPILLAVALLLAVVALFTVLLIVGPPVPKG